MDKCNLYSYERCCLGRVLDLIRMPLPATVQAPELSQFLEACASQYHACLSQLSDTHSLNGIDATVRFQHLRFDANGEPKFKDLAEMLADHIIEYCFSSRRRKGLQKPHEFARLSREGRAYLRKMNTSGEAGEMLLYLLLEAVLGAPQIVAKMELKTNPKMENHGSDGIHMKWNENDQTLDIYFGEAKLEQQIYSGLDHMMDSLEAFHAEDLLAHEFGMVTSHYKYADDHVRKTVLDILDRRRPGGDCRINHACLVGYDWDEYKKLHGVAMNGHQAEFSKRYNNDLPRLLNLVQKRFSGFSQKHLRFEIFVLPFRTVQEFRDAFNAAV